MVEKTFESVHRMICLLIASDDVISGKHHQTAYWLFNVDNWSHNNTGMTINVEIGS